MPTAKVIEVMRREVTGRTPDSLRIVPASQHGILNYSAGLLKIEFARFLGATVLAIAIKSFLYATAIQQSVNATDVRDALNTETVLALMGLALLGVSGHYVQRASEKKDGKQSGRRREGG